MSSKYASRVSILVYPETREQLRAIAEKEDRTMRKVLERAIRNEMERTGTPSTGTPSTGKQSEAA